MTELIFAIVVGMVALGGSVAFYISRKVHRPRLERRTPEDIESRRRGQEAFNSQVIGLGGVVFIIAILLPPYKYAPFLGYDFDPEPRTKVAFLFAQRPIDAEIWEIDTGLWLIILFCIAVLTFILALAVDPHRSR